MWKKKKKKRDRSKFSSEVPFSKHNPIVGVKRRALSLVTYTKPETRLASYGNPCSAVSLQNLSHQLIEKAKELHQSLDQPLVQLGRCQTQSGPKRVGFHTKGYKQLHQYSTCLPLPHMTCVELQELHSMHFLQYHSISHLHKLKY